MVMMSEVHVDGNKMAVAHCGGINHSSSSSLGFVSKNLISQNAGLGVGPLIKQQTAVTKATSGLMGDLSHYQQVPVNKSIVNKLPKESANEASRGMCDQPFYNSKVQNNRLEPVLKFVKFTLFFLLSLLTST